MKIAGADWITPVGRYLWVSQETNRVAKVDPVALRVVARVRVGANPLGSALVHGDLWVPCIDGNEIVVVDTGRARVKRRFDAGLHPLVVLSAAGPRVGLPRARVHDQPLLTRLLVAVTRGRSRASAFAAGRSAAAAPRS